MHSGDIELPILSSVAFYVSRIEDGYWDDRLWPRDVNSDNQIPDRSGSPDKFSQPANRTQRISCWTFGG